MVIRIVLIKYVFVLSAIHNIIAVEISGKTFITGIDTKSANADDLFICQQKCIDSCKRVNIDMNVFKTEAYLMFPENVSLKLNSTYPGENGDRTNYYEVKIIAIIDD